MTTAIIIRLCVMMLMMIGGLRLYQPMLSACPVLPNITWLLDITVPRQPNMPTVLSRLAALRLHLPRSDIEQGRTYRLPTIDGALQPTEASRVDLCPPSVLPRADQQSSHSQPSQQPSRLGVCSFPALRYPGHANGIVPTSFAFPAPASQQAIARSRQRDLELRYPDLVDRGQRRRSPVNHRS